jgi:hypothetical protein
MMAVGNGWSWYLDSLVLARRVSIGTARKISQVGNYSLMSLRAQPLSLLPR